MHLASYLYGVYDITIEIYLAEISLLMLMQKNFEELIFVENLLQLIENKLQKRCGLILLMDYEYDYLLKLMSGIHLALLDNYLCRPLDKYSPHLVYKIIIIINSLLNCNHHNDVI